jgi:hypothetical protein
VTTPCHLPLKMDAITENRNFFETTTEKGIILSWNALKFNYNFHFIFLIKF